MVHGSDCSSPPFTLLLTKPLALVARSTPSPHLPRASAPNRRAPATDRGAPRSSSCHGPWRHPSQRFHVGAQVQKGPPRGPTRATLLASARCPPYRACQRGRNRRSRPTARAKVQSTQCVGGLLLAAEERVLGRLRRGQQSKGVPPCCRLVLLPAAIRFVRGRNPILSPYTCPADGTPSGPQRGHVPRGAERPCGNKVGKSDRKTMSVTDGIPIGTR